MNIPELKKQTDAAFAALEKPEMQAAIKASNELAKFRFPEMGFGLLGASAEILGTLTGFEQPICHLLISNSMFKVVSDIAQPVQEVPIVVPVRPASRPLAGLVETQTAPMGNVEASGVEFATKEADSTPGSTEVGEPIATPPATT